MLHSRSTALAAAAAAAMMSAVGQAQPDAQSPFRLTSSLPRDSNKMPNHRKSGPGRKHSQGATDKDRTVRPAGVHYGKYGRGPQNHFDRAGSSKRAG